jgi:truncated hemoglobin YjbI
MFDEFSKEKIVTPGEKALTEAEYDRMAKDLEAMSQTIRLRPEMNHHFAERLALLAKQMREDSVRAHPHPKRSA